MKKIELEVECPNCTGTGIYVGIAERDGAGIVCTTCDGSGKYIHIYHYEDFNGRKVREDIKRVYRSCRYVITPVKMTFDGIGEVDMSKEGVSYKEFLNGDRPGYLEKLGCPMISDQSACHDVEGFTNMCNELNGGYVSLITSCKHQSKKASCWERFKQGSNK